MNNMSMSNSNKNMNKTFHEFLFNVITVLCPEKYPQILCGLWLTFIHKASSPTHHPQPPSTPPHTFCSSQLCFSSIMKKCSVWQRNSMCVSLTDGDSASCSVPRHSASSWLRLSCCPSNSQCSAHWIGIALLWQGLQSRLSCRQDNCAYTRTRVGRVMIENKLKCRSTFLFLFLGVAHTCQLSQN